MLAYEDEAHPIAFSQPSLIRDLLLAVNPIVLRMAKTLTLWSFGHSGCNRVNSPEFFICWPDGDYLPYRKPLHLCFKVLNVKGNCNNQD